MLRSAVLRCLPGDPRFYLREERTQKGEHGRYVRAGIIKRMNCLKAHKAVRIVLFSTSLDAVVHRAGIGLQEPKPGN